MSDEDKKLIGHLAQAVREMKSKLDNSFKLFDTRLNALESRETPTRKEEYKVQGFIGDSSKIDLLAQELKPILEKFAVKVITISRL